MFKVASSEGTPIPLSPEDKVVFGYSFHLESDRVAIVYNEPAYMGDLFGLNRSAGIEVRLTAVNKDWYEEV